MAYLCSLLYLEIIIPANALTHAYYLPSMPCIFTSNCCMQVVRQLWLVLTCAFSHVSLTDMHTRTPCMHTHTHSHAYTHMCTCIYTRTNHTYRSITYTHRVFTHGVFTHSCTSARWKSNPLQKWTVLTKQKAGIDRIAHDCMTQAYPYSRHQ